MNDLHEKLRADTPGESPAELRERAKMARQEADIADHVARTASRAYYETEGLANQQSEPVDRVYWREILSALDDAIVSADDYASKCRERANELDEQAEEASLSPSSRGLLHCEGQ